MIKKTQSISCYPVHGEKDMRWGLFVTTAGFQTIPAQEHYPPDDFPSTYSFNYQKGRILNEFQLVYITQGQGVFQSASLDLVKVSEGNLLLLFPNEWHTYKPDEAIGWEVYWVGFQGTQPSQLVREGFFEKTAPVINVGYREDLLGLFQQLISQAKQEETGFQQLIAGFIFHLLGLAFQKQQADHFEDKTMAEKIMKARMIIRQQAETITPELLATELNVSYSWFRRSFKAYTGSSPAQYITLIKMQQAKELLETTGLTITQIADQLRYTSPYYFSVSFKRTSGMTPGEYRKMAHGISLKKK